MEPHAPLFPSFIAPLSDLYGASNYRVAEAHAYARDLDDLDREELALEQTVRALVDRKAPPPIGLNFHRAQATGSAAPGAAGSVAGHPASRLVRGTPVGLEAGSRPSGSRGAYHGHVAVDDVDEDDDDEEEEEMEEEDDMEELEDEEEDDGTHTAEDDDELFPEDDEDDDELEDDEDEERGAQSDSMDMSM